MRLEGATEQWIEDNVAEEDYEKVNAFFHDYFRQDVRDSNRQPPQIKYRARSSKGDIKMYTGLFLKVDSSVSFFCCRNVVEEEEAEPAQETAAPAVGETQSESAKEPLMRFADGIVAFEVEDGCVKPLYASDNAYKFFGYSKEEWALMSKRSSSIKEFVSRTGVGYGKFMDLFENGEAEFEYIDVKTQKTRRIKAVCSHMFSDESPRQYIMFYNADDHADAKTAGGSEPLRVYIRTFGYFDVFVDGNPIAFRNKKSKELFALLVDRRGGYVSSEEAISFLWEDGPVNAVTLARYRKVALRLKNILEEYGISDVVESVNGRRRIVMDQVRCDLFDYLSRREEFAQLFKGSYLTNYSWGETTLGELLNEYTS
jgi:hypothetical protein